MKEKGFTLIELLATITILALIMAIAVPNVMSVIDKNKKNTYVEDAKKMITLAEYKVRSNTSIEYPTVGNCIVIKLKALDLTELNNAPEGGNYDKDLSYVVLANVNGTYTYFVAIMERYDSTGVKGIPLTSRAELNSEDAILKVQGSELSISEPVVGGTLNGFNISYIYES